MKHEIRVFASWCNDNSADLNMWCNTCGIMVAEFNSNDPEGEPSVERLSEIAELHRAGMNPVV
jgi:hypothetical protein